MSIVLDPDRITQTITRLRARIHERFPDSGLAGVCATAASVAHETQSRAVALARPYIWLRGGVAVVIVAGLIAQVASARYFHLERVETDALGLFQGLESAVNLLLLMGAGAWFLLTLEERFKRQRALAHLHELRSLAHVIDMHQLTKDPTILLGNFHRRTAASPARAMSEFELTRYLEYCAELLALLGKLAALYAERTRDPVVIAAVNDLESLTSNLGRKIWQKITIIKQLDEAGA